MSQELIILSLTTISIGFIHTILGPDHYVPFIVISKAREWSLRKTMWVTAICGLGHVASSVVLGLIGIALGIAVHKLEALESFRGNIAGWALIAFGLVYLVWGVRRAIRNRPHEHFHFHSNGSEHAHSHAHHKDHLHVHEKQSMKELTPWVLFTVFVFGPCEPLIPIVMYPASQGNMAYVAIVALLFSVATIGTMTAVVWLLSLGLNFLPARRLERYSHALAGATIALCGVSIQVMGL